jgi:hypothetical protein
MDILLTNKTIIIIFSVLIIFLSGCVSNGKRNEARGKLKTLLKDIEKGTIYEDFPVKYYTKKQLDLLVTVLRDTCQFSKRRCSYFRETFESNLGRPDKAIFVFDCCLKCDSMRFTITYNLGDTVELHNFAVQKLSRKE